MNIKERLEGLEKPPYGRTIKVMGKEIFFIEKGIGQAILYIHGNLGSHKWFSQVMDIEDFRTIALDMPNFGFSDPMESSDIADYSEFLREFIRELQLEKPVVAGHSLGGAVAISLSVKYPDLPGALMLIDSSSIKGLITPEEAYPIIEMYKVDYNLLKSALASIMPGINEERLVELTDMALLMNHDSYSGHARSLERFDLSNKAEKMKCPVLFIRGAGDFLITQKMAEETVSILGGSTLEIENSGHSPQVEVPDLFINILKKFLK
jgi:branched-chain amino acid transport system permease protein